MYNVVFIMICGIGGIEVFWYIVLFVASIFGGLVGSLSGGAGMITMPLLLLSGLNPLQALSTNKLQACVGSFTGAAHYYKSGLMDFQQSRAYIISQFYFQALGRLWCRLSRLSFSLKSCLL